MRHESRSQTTFSATRAMAKMIEFEVPAAYRNLNITQKPEDLFVLCLGTLGDVASAENRETVSQLDVDDTKEQLQFSARFFDAYIRTDRNNGLDEYLLLLGSASFYLCKIPGSTKVLASFLPETCPDLEGEGLEDLLLWLLRGDTSEYFYGNTGGYWSHVDSISEAFSKFQDTGNEGANFVESCSELRELVYAAGTPRQLLLADIVAAVSKEKIRNSIWHALPKYSGISSSDWSETIARSSFIKEFWPAQHLLGEFDVLKGESAIIQMPTSAGKTKALELIIRSAFLSERTKLSVIVAPFRALCTEIRNDLVKSFNEDSISVSQISDAIQVDFDIDNFLVEPNVLVVTPEKLLYVLRQSPELAEQIGLIAFDEGHQFDSGTRGITYELLLTSLRLILPKRSQKILISAVITNGEAVGEWLNGPDSAVVSGSNLLPTIRSVAAASWKTTLGRIDFLDEESLDQLDFFVPRVLERLPLKKKGKETKERYFPDKNDSKSIALFLGLRLFSKGSVAIFCGRKDTANSICKIAVDCFERSLSMNFPIDDSDHDEVAKLSSLLEKNLGGDAMASKCAKLGIYSHHGNTPHGLRLAVEYAMREDLIRFVVCTSTLAQGVNLPIRYLIVTTVYQGGSLMQVRDFHNLAGRAGRAGLHTEGSILFADAAAYDSRKNWRNSWRWERVMDLVDPSNSEPCESMLLTLFDPILSENKKHESEFDLMEFLDRRKESVETAIATMAQEYAVLDGFSAADITWQLSRKHELISAVESFLFANWDVGDEEPAAEEFALLAGETFGYSIVDDELKRKLVDAFVAIAAHVDEQVPSGKKRKSYGKLLYGVEDAIFVDNWVIENFELIHSAEDEQLVDLFWPLFEKFIKNSSFTNCDPQIALLELTTKWMSGVSFQSLLSTVESHGARRKWGEKHRDFDVEGVVDICENGLTFDGSLVIAAVVELLPEDDERTEQLVERLQLFQKRLKYGLPTAASITLYELGFADRVVAQDIAESCEIVSSKPRKTIRILKQAATKQIAAEVVARYPQYFQTRFEEIIGQKA